jgi:hypothetical protein
MQTELRRVLELQSLWSSKRTPEMGERGELIRNRIPEQLRSYEVKLSSAVGVPVSDFFVEGRDGTGRKTRVPWVRFCSQERSPSATEGFYVVYLWSFDGGAVYLSLIQGTTDFRDGEFVRKPLDVLASRVKWARNILAGSLMTRSDLSELALEDLGEASLGRGYELGNVASIRYAPNAIPNDEHLLADAVDFAEALGQLYGAHARTPLPDEIPELAALENAVDEAAGNARNTRGAGFRQNKEERDLIEKYAIKVAEAYYVKRGWKVRTVGAPYDLGLTRGSERWTVEVKGTSSMGESVVLTAGEVKHHAKAHPNNALVVVRGIVLDRSTSPPGVTGGVLYERQPWNIDDDALSTIAYKYTVPEDLYSGDGFKAGELL